MNKLLLLIVILSLVATQCDDKDPDCPQDSHNGFTITNKSKRRINFEFYWNYPDTVIGEYNPKNFGVINPNGSGVRGAGRNSCIESLLKSLPHQKDWLYIFDEDSIEKIPWDTVRITNRGLLERRLISLPYLQKNDFKITYP